MVAASLDLNQVIATSIPGDAATERDVRKITNSSSGVLWSTPSANIRFRDNLPVSISYFRNFTEPFSAPAMRAKIYAKCAKNPTGLIP